MAVLGSRTAAVPSVIFVSADEREVLVGEAARRRLASDPGRVAREFKRRLGDATPIFVGETPRSAESLLAVVLRWVVDRVREQEGADPDRVVVTHPANWGAYRRELLDHAIRQSDVAGVSTLTEPEAAAVYYASTERIEAGELIAVYDLGGGTFDAALLRRTVSGFELVGAPEGIEHLGGIDVDEAIFEHVRRALGSAVEGLDADDPAVMRALLRLREECTEAKETLSFDSRATIPVLLPGVQSEVVITRGELEPMIRPLLADTIGALRRAFAAAGVEPGGVRAVLLVGGSSRIPLVAEMITAELGRPVALDAHPKHAIALGAALTAAGAVGVAGAAVAAPEDEVPAAREPRRRDAERQEPTPAPPAPPASPRRHIPVAALVAAAAVVAVLAVILLTRGGGDGGDATGTTVAPITTAPATTITAGPGIPVGTPLGVETIAYGRATGETCNVWQVDADGSGAQAITSETGCAQFPALSPDRRSIAYTASGPDGWQLWVVDAQGGDKQVVAENQAPGTRATWSPDGERMAYVGIDARGVKDIYVLDLATLDAENITQDDEEEGAPAWSPDGTRIAFWSKVDGNIDVYAMRPDGSEVQRLTTDPGEDSDPAWRPDGGLLAFGSSRLGNWEIFVMNPDGSDQRNITNNDSADEDPSWSPDGTRIAFNSKRDTPERDDFAELYVMNADGSAQRRLTTADALDAYATWGVEAGSAAG
jgi:Tol biopolymer transport system component/actin-like ATPase involved in cell morphogenesis